MVLAGGPFGLGAPELILILAVVVVIFGGTKLADLGGSLGKGIKEFKANVKDDEPAAPPPAATPPPAAVVATPLVTAAPVEAPVASAAPAPVAPAPVANAVQAIQCASCHTLNPMGSKHCNQCGSSLAAPVS